MEGLLSAFAFLDMKHPMRETQDDRRCWIYKSRQREGMYLYLARENGFDDLPTMLQKIFGLPEFVMELRLGADIKLASEDPAKVVENLNNQGFHLQMPPGKIESQS